MSVRETFGVSRIADSEPEKRRSFCLGDLGGLGVP
jgi:hypothetical protein